MPQTQAEVHPCWRESLTAPRCSVNPELEVSANAVAGATGHETPETRPGALADRLEEQRRGGRGDVERVELAGSGRRDEAVAGVGDPRPDPLALAAEDEDGGAAQVDLPGRRLGLRVGAPDPEAGLLRLRQPVGEVADAGDVEVLDGAGRGLAGGGGDLGGAPFGDDDAGGAGELGRAADGAEVARVLDLVEGDDQRALAAQQQGVAVLRRGRRIDLGDDALVVGRAAQSSPALRSGSPAPARRGARAACRARPPRPGVCRRSICPRPSPSAPRHQPRALGAVAHLPAELGEAVAELVGALEVLRRPRLARARRAAARPPRPPRPRPRRATRARAAPASPRAPAPPRAGRPRRGSRRRPARTPGRWPWAC